MSVPTTEVGAMQQLIRALKADGWELDFVYDGEEDIPVDTETAAIKAVTDVDQAHMNFKKREPNGVVYETGWIFFVLGNDPEEVANDWTTNLTPVSEVTRSWF